MCDSDDRFCEWITDSEYPDFWVSQCGFHHYFQDGFHPIDAGFVWCPYCGARVRIRLLELSPRHPAPVAPDARGANLVTYENKREIK